MVWLVTWDYVIRSYLVGSGAESIVIGGVYSVVRDSVRDCMRGALVATAFVLAAVALPPLAHAGESGDSGDRYVSKFEKADLESQASGTSWQAMPRPSALAFRRRTCTNYVNGSQAFPNFEKRRGISCRQARAVYRGARSGLGRAFPPGCRVGKTARWRGWVIRAIGGFEAHRFSKGKRRFTASGGGVC